MIPTIVHINLDQTGVGVQANKVIDEFCDLVNPVILHSCRIQLSTCASAGDIMNAVAKATLIIVLVAG